ncbi:hypothetical protein MBLNU459_g6446t2 [Dothideomycetes sp. NU459]
MADSLTRTPFPQKEEDFAYDVRISYNKETKEHALKDGNITYYWNPRFQKWAPGIDEAERQKHLDMYKKEGDEDKAEEAVDVRKRKAEQQQAAAEAKKARKIAKERPNTAVYVTNIPLDADVNDIAAVFRKVGIIEEDIHTGLAKIKMYADDHGDFTGCARVIYFQPVSVQLAIQLLDETDFKMGGSGTMRVEEATFSHGTKEVSVDDMQNATKKKKSKEDRHLAIEKTKQMKARLADWSDDEPSAITTTADSVSKYSKLVVIKHMFTQKEIEKDKAAIIEIKDDARTEAEKLGTVTNVVLYDKEPEGIVTIRFTEPSAARDCVNNFNGRFFDGRTLQAYVPLHREKFRKSKADVSFVIDDSSASSDEEEEAENGGQ